MNVKGRKLKKDACVFEVVTKIKEVNKKTLVLAHNKTLAGQLYAELKEFFPNNRVEYFVSNFDYYQPEAYIPSSDVYIDKTATTNQELDMLRMAATNSVLDRRDTIVVASVACIYGASNPEQYKDMFFTIRVGEIIDRKELLKKLFFQAIISFTILYKFTKKGDFMFIQIDFNSDEAIYVQLQNQIIMGIATAGFALNY